MRRAAFRVVTGIALAMTFTVAPGTTAGFQRARKAPALREYFQELLQKPRPVAPLKPDDVTLSRIFENASREEIPDALPTILGAAQDKDTIVSGLGSIALMAIAQRQDSRDLLSGHSRELTGLLSSDDRRVAWLALTTISWVWVQPPPEVFSILMGWLTNADPIKGAAAFEYLVERTGNRPEVVAAATRFWSRPMDTRARVNALDGLANAHPKDPRLIDLAVSELDNKDFDIQWEAYQAVVRMGPEAWRQAQAPMQKVIHQYVELLKQPDADPQRRSGALAMLLFPNEWRQFPYKPTDDPEVMDTLVKFYSRSLGAGHGLPALEALRHAHIDDERIVSLVIAALHDPRPEVRRDAADALPDFGPQALLKAEPALKALADNPAGRADVAEAARKALERLPDAHQ